ncbi:MAG: bifunctional cobalt-precorrin-7 (C(5))-methyltransferase/cobalt-precorrin-6B (C(15))-methyltransferase [Thermoleophilia bacterium]
MVGTGPGPGYLTPRARELMLTCDDFVGGRAALAEAPAWGDHLLIQGPLGPLLDEVERRLDAGRDVCVLTSGDPGYFSLLAALDRRFPAEARVEPGISSVQLLAARLGVSWDKVAHFSVHGRELDFDPPSDRPFVVLLDPANDAAVVAAYLLERGVKGRAALGVGLGREDERVIVRELGEVPDQKPEGPAVLMVFPEGALPRASSFAAGTGPERGGTLTAGQDSEAGPVVGATEGSPADDDFIRKEGVPLSRWESRLVLAGIARPEMRRVIWDVGAGSGGFTVEMGLRSPLARIVAFERSEEACAALRSNISRFGVRAEVVERAAPQGFADAAAAQAPDLVVVGGSGGRLAKVLEEIADRIAPGGRVVCAAVTLETISTATQVLSEPPWRGFDAVQISSARRARLGIMQGANPVTFLWADRRETREPSREGAAL